jgi:hypothetical protein
MSKKLALSLALAIGASTMMLAQTHPAPSDHKADEHKDKKAPAPADHSKEKEHKDGKAKH